MNLLILAAGHATRLRPLTDSCAKPLLPIGDRAILDLILACFHGCAGDINQVCVVTNHKFSHDFHRWAATAKEHPFAVEILDNGTDSNDDRLGAIADMWMGIEHLGLSDDLCVVAGDNLFASGDLSAFVADARTAQVAVGVYDVGSLDAVKGLGQVQVDDDGRILALIEKPTQPMSTLVSAGLYFFAGSVLPLIGTYLASGGTTDGPGHLIAWLLARIQCSAHRIAGAWLDIGSKEAYAEAQKRYGEQP